MTHNDKKPIKNPQQGPTPPDNPHFAPESGEPTLQQGAEPPATQAKP